MNHAWMCRNTIHFSAVIKHIEYYLCIIRRVALILLHTIGTSNMNMNTKSTTQFDSPRLCHRIDIGRKREGKRCLISSPTNHVIILEPRIHQSEELSVFQKRRSTDFKTFKLLKSRLGGENNLSDILLLFSPHETLRPICCCSCCCCCCFSCYCRCCCRCCCYCLPLLSFWIHKNCCLSMTELLCMHVLHYYWYTFVLHNDAICLDAWNYPDLYIITCVSFQVFDQLWMVKLVEGFSPSYEVFYLTNIFIFSGGGFTF